MYTKESIETFLQNQGRLFDEEVAASYEEAEEFLEDCMAMELKTLKEVREELEDASEVFRLPSGGYLVVEG